MEAPAALVREPVPPSRATLGWLLRRRFRSGQTYGVRLRRSGESRLKSAAAAVAKILYCAGTTFATLPSPVGWRRNLLVQKSDARKIYHQMIGDETWSAIQITTAAGVCAILDLHMTGQLPQRGFVIQEQVDFDIFIANRFGRYYECDSTTRFTSGNSHEIRAGMSGRDMDA